MMSISVQMFPAGCGDSFLLKLGKTNILIDGGFNETYECYIRKELCQLAEKQEKLDLVVVTHFDHDHLLGILSFIRENGDADNPQIIAIDDFWYNCSSSLTSGNERIECLSIIEKEIIQSYLQNNQYNQQLMTSSEAISAVQGMGLAYHLINGKYAINRAIGDTVNSAVPEISIEQNVQIQILSPSCSQLKTLSQYWHTELKKKKWTFNITNDPLFNRAMEAYLLFGYSYFENKSESISEDSQQVDIENLLSKQTTTDRSVVNASSIALLIKSKDKLMLFLGDAHEEQILHELQRIFPVAEDMPFFDLIKVSHHGSLKNNMNLFDTIDGHIFLISTDGIKHGHPDFGTIARIIIRPTKRNRKLIFNYANDAFVFFNRSDWMKKYNYSVLLNNMGTSIQI